MAQDVYLYAHKRTTNELEHDQTTSPGTKKVSVYGWDGSSKVRLLVDTDGSLLTNELGALTHQSAITVSSALTSAGVSTGKKWLNLFNNGGSIMYIGDSGVTSGHGTQVLPKQSYTFDRCKSSFKTYMICEVGASASARILER